LTPCGAWVPGWIGWSDEGGSGSNEIGYVGHDGTKVAVAAATELAMDGTGVGIEFFFELLDGSGGRLTVKLGEFHMGERKSCCGHGCCCWRPWRGLQGCCCWKPWRGSRGYNNPKNNGGGVFLKV
jgi:hypothetical protein